MLYAWLEWRLCNVLIWFDYMTMVCHIIHERLSCLCVDMRISTDGTYYWWNRHRVIYIYIYIHHINISHIYISYIYVNHIISYDIIHWIIHPNVKANLTWWNDPPEAVRQVLEFHGFSVFMISEYIPMFAGSTPVKSMVLKSHGFGRKNSPVWWLECQKNLVKPQNIRMKTQFNRQTCGLPFWPQLVDVVFNLPIFVCSPGPLGPGVGSADVRGARHGARGICWIMRMAWGYNGI